MQTLLLLSCSRRRGFWLASSLMLLSLLTPTGWGIAENSLRAAGPEAKSPAFDWTCPDPIPHLGEEFNQGDGWQFLQVAADVAGAREVGLNEEQLREVRKQLAQATQEARELRLRMREGKVTENYVGNGSAPYQILWQSRADVIASQMTPAQRRRIRQLIIQRLDWHAFERNEVRVALNLNYGACLSLGSIIQAHFQRLHDEDRRLDNLVEQFSRDIEASRTERRLDEIQRQLDELKKLASNREEFTRKSHLQMWQAIYDLFTPEQRQDFNRLRGAKMATTPAEIKDQPQSAADPDWINVGSGLQYRVRLAEERPVIGLLPQIFVDLRNRNRKSGCVLNLHQFQHRLKFDGQQYVPGTPLGGYSERLLLGEPHITLVFTLSGDWKRERQDGPPLQLTEGRHQVSFSIGMWDGSNWGPSQEWLRLHNVPVRHPPALETAPVNFQIVPGRWNGSLSSMALENLRRELMAFPVHPYQQMVAPNALRLASELQPASSDYLLGLLEGKDELLHSAAQLALVKVCQSLSDSQFERYLRTTLKHSTRYRGAYPQGTDITIAVWLTGGPEQAVPEPFRAKLTNTTQYLLDGQPLPKEAQGIPIKNLSIGRHTFKATSDYKVVWGRTTYEGHCESKEFAVEILPASAPNDLIAPEDDRLTRLVSATLLMGNTESEVNPRLAFEMNHGGIFGRPRRQLPQHNFGNVIIQTPVWNLTDGLPVDLCFNVEFRLEKSGEVIRGSDLLVRAGTTYSSYFSIGDMQTALKLLHKHADQDGNVSVVIALTPSHAVALAEPDVRRYFGGKLVSKPLRFKVGKSEQLNFQLDLNWDH